MGKLEGIQEKQFKLNLNLALPLNFKDIFKQSRLIVLKHLPFFSLYSLLGSKGIIV